MIYRRAVSSRKQMAGLEGRDGRKGGTGRKGRKGGKRKREGFI
jgi:hypothetical protein